MGIEEVEHGVNLLDGILVPLTRLFPLCEELDEDRVRVAADKLLKRLQHARVKPR